MQVSARLVHRGHLGWSRGLDASGGSTRWVGVRGLRGVWGLGLVFGAFVTRVPVFRSLCW